MENADQDIPDWNEEQEDSAQLSKSFN